MLRCTPTGVTLTRSLCLSHDPRPYGQIERAVWQAATAGRWVGACGAACGCVVCAVTVSAVQVAGLSWLRSRQ